MHIMNRITLWCLASLLVLSVLPAAAQQREQISAIYSKHPLHWQQDYDAHGRTIAVDLTIRVPSVSSVPVLKMRRLGQLSDPHPALWTNTPRAQIFNTLYPAQGPTLPDHVRPALDTLQSPVLSIEEPDAKSVLDQLIRSVPAHQGLQLDILSLLSLGPAYPILKDKKSGQLSVSFEQAVDDHGLYEARLVQTFDGIPFLVGAGYFQPKIKNEVEVPLTPNRAEIKSEHEYLMALQLLVPDEVVVPDIALVPPGSAVRAIELCILSGQVRRVDSITLAYMAFNDPRGNADIYYLRPVWVLLGEIYKDAVSKRPADFLDAYPALNRDKYWRTLYPDMLAVDAITGQLYDWQDRSPQRLTMRLDDLQ